MRSSEDGKFLIRKDDDEPSTSSRPSFSPRYRRVPSTICIDYRSPSDHNPIFISTSLHSPRATCRKGQVSVVAITQEVEVAGSAPPATLVRARSRLVGSLSRAAAASQPPSPRCISRHHSLGKPLDDQQHHFQSTSAVKSHLSLPPCLRCAHLTAERDLPANHRGYSRLDLIVENTSS